VASPVKRQSSAGARDSGTWRQQQAAVTRQRISDAARSLFATGGYASTSMEAIAREAGVGVRTVYAVFGTKREILSGICEDWLERAGARRAAAKVLGEGDIARRVVAAAQWLANLYSAGFDVVQILEFAEDEGPATRELLAAKLAGRDSVMDRFVASLAPGLIVPEAEASAMFRALAAPGVYRELVERAGWTHEQFAHWLAETLGRYALGLSVVLTPIQEPRAPIGP
jgi:AcrR family transcriptional regulator